MASYVARAITTERAPCNNTLAMRTRTWCWECLSKFRALLAKRKGLGQAAVPETPCSAQDGLCLTLFIDRNSNASREVQDQICGSDTWPHITDRAAVNARCSYLPGPLPAMKELLLSALQWDMMREACLCVFQKPQRRHIETASNRDTMLTFRWTFGLKNLRDFQDSL